MKNILRPLGIFVIAALTALATLGITYAALNIDTQKSTVNITAKQMNVPINGQFSKFNATIDYNQNSPETAKARVEIDISSFNLGDAEINQEVLKKEWFNAAQFPKATFVSTSIKPVSHGKMIASGKLTVKGTTLDVNFPVVIAQQGKAIVFDGELPIHRLAFHIGEGDWADTSMVADEVIIKFHIVSQ